MEMIEFQRNTRNTGCSIPVVRLLWEQIDWVRFPAARPLLRQGYAVQATKIVSALSKKLILIYRREAVSCVALAKQD